MTTEIFKPIPRYEDHYEASNTGKVRNLKSGRILLPALVGAGYPRVSLCVDGKAKAFFVHRLVMMTFVGDCPDGMSVNHRDGNKTNNNLSNLEYVTFSQNTIHAIAVLGRRIGALKGNRYAAKLTSDQVDEVRALRSSGMKQKAIAEIFGVSDDVISNILIGRTWKQESAS